jgi:hypothetical protein
MAGTKEDAAMVIELAKWGAMIEFGPAFGALLDEEFDPQTAAATDAPVRTVLTFGETVGTLVENGLLDRELILDWLWVEGMWAKVGPAAARLRESTGEPRLYENFEALSGATPA